MRPYVPTTTLSGREKQVLHLYGEGNTEKQIGKILGISHRTVEQHTARARLKTGARNTCHAVTLSIRRGLL